jgi:hypothetical protein
MPRSAGPVNTAYGVAHLIIHLLSKDPQKKNQVLAEDCHKRKNQVLAED